MDGAQWSHEKAGKVANRGDSGVDNQDKEHEGQRYWKVKAREIDGQVTQSQETEALRGYCISINKHCMWLIIYKKYMLNKMALNRNIHKIRLLIDWKCDQSL